MSKENILDFTVRDLLSLAVKQYALEQEAISPAPRRKQMSSIKDAADRLKEDGIVAISESTLRRLIDIGTIPCFRTAGRTFVDYNDILDYVDQNTVAAKKEVKHRCRRNEL